MGYIAVKGGTEAIEQSIALLHEKRTAEQLLIEVDVIRASMRMLVDQVMSEASLYDRTLAALAIKQAEGNMEEAVFLLRAHRSTLPRLYYTNVVDTREMFVERRVSASFKDIPGGQILGASPDFTHRLLNFDLMDESLETTYDMQGFRDDSTGGRDDVDLTALPKVIDYLASVGLYEAKEMNDSAPDDITKRAITFPATRSQCLQSLTRGQTGAVTSLGYAEVRGYGFSTHPNIGELRVGEQPLYLNGEGDEGYFIGDIQLTEVESFYSADAVGADGNTVMTIDLGYGLTFGQNETKTIAMSILDHSLRSPDFDVPTSDDEFVLLHIDSVESTGFISHLKLPHYVTFQSMLDRIRQKKKEQYS